jgi:hypothetical protein
VKFPIYGEVVWLFAYHTTMTDMQLLFEFIGSQKIRLVGVGVSRLRERDARQMLITDF